MKDLISRQAAIGYIDRVLTIGTGKHKSLEFIRKYIETLPSAQPESYKEKLKEIADELSEKFAYLNTCPNERDIILGYLGVKRPRGIHCDTDCIITKCESNHHYTKSEIIRCRECKHYDGRPCGIVDWYNTADDFCSNAERRQG